MQILVWTHKHGQAFYDASTPEALDAASIEILGQLLEDGYLYPATPYVPEKTAELATVDEATLPRGAMGLFKDVQTAKKYVVDAQKRADEENIEYNQAREFVEAGESPRMTMGVGTKWERTISGAWQILQNRNGAEYEDYELVDVKMFEPKN